MIDLTPWLDAPAWYIAFSGGLDSTVLLHLLAHHRLQHQTPTLRALHVHHGLQAAADAWPAHCQQVCDELGVELRVLHVQVAPGASLEQAARNARYAAFVDAMVPDAVLFTGQHRDDQAETLLLQLLRGAGVRGLAGMPGERSLGQGALVRPLLGLSRSQLQDYARAHGLRWIEDPSNADTEHARNYLRHHVVPVLQQRWPQATQTLARSAEHLGEALGLLDELACADLAQASTASPYDWLKLDSLQLPALSALSPARQRNALQHWLAGRTRLPDSRHWAGWEALRDAAQDAQPLWCLTDGLLQRSHQRIWWLAGEWLQSPAGQVPWPDPRVPLVLPGNGSVRLSGNLPQGPLCIGYRQGGESLQMGGRGRRDLKRLLNELQVPHFARGRLPLLFQGDWLLAVGNLPVLSQGEWQLHWEPPTSAQGLR
ncbi:tRNA(Ile)-lysidine synthase [Pseudomonas fluorescens]|uniref:tRNA lysidine(34) synthetase TilS n=1 Tax=Pseudomonas fluorescens TaxID=294 RepID=UPI0012595209|nr:tRNA lysidine(34) synthetase TilS [Pseudomonas fluorescens]CAG8866219.1 tRNA(Ile)-lysidine synthase [Pseudomonas fluorescens]VVP74822.1 tRNA(Ile)-lysidine synthase [Pseudomonas fluorescens]